MTDHVRELASALGGAANVEGEALLFRPLEADEAARGVRLAHERGVRVEARGEPRAGVMTLDLSGLDRILEIDGPSRLIHAEVGVPLAEVEERLRESGSSLMTSATGSLTVGAYLESGCAGTRSIEDDPVGQVVAGIVALTPDGRLLEIRPAPRRAVGPDWIGAILAGGSEIAIPVSAHLVAREARSLHALGFYFSSRDAAEQALAWMRGRGARPAHARLRDEGEGALLSIWLEAGPLLSPMQAIVVEEARSRGATLTEAGALAADPPARAEGSALGGFTARLRSG